MGTTVTVVTALERRQAQAIAMELLVIQRGSAEDAKAVLDDSFPYWQRELIAEAIEEISDEAVDEDAPLRLARA